MKCLLVLFICFFSSLYFVNIKDNSYVLNGEENSIYVFKDYTENDENVTNPETDDLELRSNIVIVFYSFLFIWFFIIKLKNSDKYIIYNC